MNVEIIPAYSLSASEAKRYRSLSFRDQGRMCEDFTRVREFHPEGRVLSIKDDSGRILAWALTWPHRCWDTVQGKHRKMWDFEVYTRVSERRKGYGTALYKAALTLARKRANLKVHPSDDTTEFFSKVHNPKPRKVTIR